MITTHVDSIPLITRDEAARLASTEYARLFEVLAVLGGDDWTRPTDCSMWDVRALAGHCVGEISDLVSVRALLRRTVSVSRVARATGQATVDVMTAAQVADNAGLTTSELVARAERNIPLALRLRSGLPWLLRQMPIGKQEVGGVAEGWRLAYLLDIILTRDPWMHRIDITRATGRELVLTADHDGRIVADVVAEWARRHGRPFALTLTGPAGGEFAGGGDEAAAERITMDAVEFCRTLSGRSPATGLLSQEVPF